MPTIEELAAEVAALRRRIDATEGILELQALKARYGELVDGRYSGGGVVDTSNWHSWPMRCPSCSPSTGNGTEGRGSARPSDVQPSPTGSARRPSPSHAISSSNRGSTWTGTGQRPGGTCSVRAVTATVGPIWMCGYEDDEYVRTDGAWLYRSMKLTTLFMSPVEEGWAKILA